jgi:hypothetical protein
VRGSSQWEPPPFRAERRSAKMFNDFIYLILNNNYVFVGVNMGNKKAKNVVVLGVFPM